jgi:hypothetical protein
MNWRGELRDRQIDVDSPFQLGPGGVLESTPRLTAEQ